MGRKEGQSSLGLSHSFRCGRRIFPSYPIRLTEERPSIHVWILVGTASSGHERRNEVDAEVMAEESRQQLLPHGKIKDCRSDGLSLLLTAGALQVHRDFVTTVLEQQRWRTMLPTTVSFSSEFATTTAINPQQHVVPTTRPMNNFSEAEGIVE